MGNFDNIVDFSKEGLKVIMGLDINQQKSKITEFIKRGEMIKVQENHLPEKDFLMSDYVSGPMLDQWINEINVFNERYLKNHQLYGLIKNICLKYKNMFSPCDDIIGYLKTILIDNEFWEEQNEDIIKTQNCEISNETEKVLYFLLDIHNSCDGEIYLEDNDFRIKNILNYEKALKRLYAEGYFITYKPDVTGGYEIELSKKALTYNKKQNLKTKPTANMTNIYISGDVNASNLSTGTNSHQNLTNVNKNQSTNKETWFERYWFPLIIALIGAVGTVIGALIGLLN